MDSRLWLVSSRSRSGLQTSPNLQSVSRQGGCSMSLSYRSLPIFLFFFLAVPLLWAQAAKTSIIIERQAVHFITPGEAVEWQLVISNQQGEVIFDSGLLYGSALEWPLKNQQ